MLYLTNRAIGQSAMTREYVFSLEEAGIKMPRGPLLLQVDSLVGALQTEVRESRRRVELTKNTRIKYELQSRRFYLIFCLLLV